MVDVSFYDLQHFKGLRIWSSPETLPDPVKSSFQFSDLWTVVPGVFVGVDPWKFEGHGFISCPMYGTTCHQEVDKRPRPPIPSGIETSQQGPGSTWEVEEEEGAARKVSAT